MVLVIIDDVVLYASEQKSPTLDATCLHPSQTADAADLVLSQIHSATALAFSATLAAISPTLATADLTADIVELNTDLTTEPSLHNPDLATEVTLTIKFLTKL